MKCLIEECTNKDDCVVLENTKKQPKNSSSCSYFRTLKQLEKKAKKKEELIDEVKKFKKAKK